MFVFFFIIIEEISTGKNPDTFQIDLYVSKIEDSWCHCIVPLPLGMIIQKSI